ncbi:MAG: hypothetical protein M3400_17090, partial [Actinomycetota bacterium]|nr:hypothetical protein [Actinomycetota bacterium]
TDSRGVLRPGTEADPEVARVGRLAEAAARRIDDGVQRTWNAEHNRVSFERSGRELSVAIYVREPAAGGRPSPEPAVMVNSTGSIALVIVSPGANLDALAVALDQAVQQALGDDTAAKTPSDRFDDFVLAAVTESLTTGQDSAVIVQPGRQGDPDVERAMRMFAAAAERVGAEIEREGSFITLTRPSGKPIGVQVFVAAGPEGQPMSEAVAVRYPKLGGNLLGLVVSPGVDLDAVSDQIDRLIREAFGRAEARYGPPPAELPEFGRARDTVVDAAGAFGLTARRHGNVMTLSDETKEYGDRRVVQVRIIEASPAPDGFPVPEPAAWVDETTNDVQVAVVAGANDQALTTEIAEAIQNAHDVQPTNADIDRAVLAANGLALGTEETPGIAQVLGMIESAARALGGQAGPLTNGTVHVEVDGRTPVAVRIITALASAALPQHESVADSAHHGSSRVLVALTPGADLSGLSDKIAADIAAALDDDGLGAQGVDSDPVTRAAELVQATAPWAGAQVVQVGESNLDRIAIALDGHPIQVTIVTDASRAAGPPRPVGVERIGTDQITVTVFPGVDLSDLPYLLYKQVTQIQNALSPLDGRPALGEVPPVSAETARNLAADLIRATASRSDAQVLGSTVQESDLGRVDINLDLNGHPIRVSILIDASVTEAQAEPAGVELIGTSQIDVTVFPGVDLEDLPFFFLDAVSQIQETLADRPDDGGAPRMTGGKGIEESGSNATPEPDPQETAKQYVLTAGFTYADATEIDENGRITLQRRSGRITVDIIEATPGHPVSTTEITADGNVRVTVPSDVHQMIASRKEVLQSIATALNRRAGTGYVPVPGSADPVADEMEALLVDTPSGQSGGAPALDWDWNLLVNEAWETAAQAARDTGAEPHLIGGHHLTATRGDHTIEVHIGPETQAAQPPGRSQSRVGIDDRGRVHVAMSTSMMADVRPLIAQAIDSALTLAQDADPAPQPIRGPAASRLAAWGMVEFAAHLAGATNVLPDPDSPGRVEVVHHNGIFTVTVHDGGQQLPGDSPTVSWVGMDDVGGVTVSLSDQPALAAVQELINQAVRSAFADSDVRSDPSGSNVEDLIESVQEQAAVARAIALVDKAARRHWGRGAEDVTAGSRSRAVLQLRNEEGDRSVFVNIEFDKDPTLLLNQVGIDSLGDLLVTLSPSLAPDAATDRLLDRAIAEARTHVIDEALNWPKWLTPGDLDQAMGDARTMVERAVQDNAGGHRVTVNEVRNPAVSRPGHVILTVDVQGVGSFAVDILPEAETVSDDVLSVSRVGLYDTGRVRIGVAPEMSPELVSPLIDEVIRMALVVSESPEMGALTLSDTVDATLRIGTEEDPEVTAVAEMVQAAMADLSAWPSLDSDEVQNPALIDVHRGRQHTQVEIMLAEHSEDGRPVREPTVELSPFNVVEVIVSPGANPDGLAAHLRAKIDEALTQSVPIIEQPTADDPDIRDAQEIVEAAAQALAAQWNLDADGTYEINREGQPAKVIILVTNDSFTSAPPPLASSVQRRDQVTVVLSPGANLSGLADEIRADIEAALSYDASAVTPVAAHAELSPAAEVLQAAAARANVPAAFVKDRFVIAPDRHPIQGRLVAVSDESSEQPTPARAHWDAALNRLIVTFSAEGSLDLLANDLDEILSALLSDKLPLINAAQQEVSDLAETLGMEPRRGEGNNLVLTGQDGRDITVTFDVADPAADGPSFASIALINENADVRITLVPGTDNQLDTFVTLLAARGHDPAGGFVPAVEHPTVMVGRTEIRYAAEALGATTRVIGNRSIEVTRIADGARTTAHVELANRAGDALVETEAFVLDDGDVLLAMGLPGDFRRSLSQAISAALDRAATDASDGPRHTGGKGVQPDPTVGLDAITDDVRESAQSHAEPHEVRSGRQMVKRAVTKVNAAQHIRAQVDEFDQPHQDGIQLLVSDGGRMVAVEVRMGSWATDGQTVARVDMYDGHLKLVVLMSEGPASDALETLVQRLIGVGLDHSLDPTPPPGYQTDPEIGPDVISAVQDLVASPHGERRTEEVRKVKQGIRVRGERTVYVDVVEGHTDTDSPVRIDIDAAGRLTVTASPEAPQERLRSLLAGLTDVAMNTPRTELPARAEPSESSPTDWAATAADLLNALTDAARAAAEATVEGNPDDDRGTTALAPDADPGQPRETGGKGVAPSSSDPSRERSVEVAATAVPGSKSHGPRSMFAHPGRIMSRVAQAMADLAASDAAIIDPVRATDDGTYQARTPGGRYFRVSVTTVSGGTPDSIGSDVARGSVDLETGQVGIRISDQANLRGVPRTLASILAEAAAVLDGMADQSEVLSDHAPTAEQSVLRRGKLAQLRYEAAQLQSANPLTRRLAGREAAALLHDLNLMAGVADLETGEFADRSPGFQDNLAKLGDADRVLIAKLNFSTLVAPMPSTVPETWRYLTKGLLTGVTAALLPATALAVAAGPVGAPVLLTVAAMTASAGMTGAMVGTFAERVHAKNLDRLIRDVYSSIVPLSPATRQLVDVEAADLVERAEQARQRTLELTEQLHGDVNRKEKLGDAAGRSSAAPVSRFSTAPTAAVPPGQSQRAAPMPAGLAALMRSDAVRAALEPRAGERFTAQDFIPGRRSWIMRAAAGPFAGAGIGFLASQIAVTAFALPTSGVVLAGLAIGAVASVFAARGQHKLMQTWAVGEDAQENTKYVNMEAMARARIDAALSPLRDEQAALDQQAARREALAAWLATAEQALIDDAQDPAGARLGALDPPPSLVEQASPSRAGDLSQRASILRIAANPDSRFTPDGAARADPQRVQDQALRTLANLGPRDGVTSATIDDRGVVELQLIGEAEPVRLAVDPVDSEGPRSAALVARVVASPDPDGPRILQISDEATDRTVTRAVLIALEQILADRAGAPTGADQLAPGPTNGPTDPAKFTAADHGRIRDITGLLDDLDTARRRERRDLLVEYQAAVRAAGLDLPMEPDTDPAVTGAPARRVALDPALLAGLEARDRLPSLVPSLWAHQRKWLGTMAFPAVATPVAWAVLRGLSWGSAPAMVLGVAGPLAVGGLSAIAEWNISRSVEKQQLAFEIGSTVPSPATLAREDAYRSARAAELAAARERARAAEQQLQAQRDRFQAILAQAERNGVVGETLHISRVLDAISRTDTAPVPGPNVASPTSSGRARTSPAARAAVSSAADRAASAAALEQPAPVATETVEAEVQEKGVIRKAHPRHIDYAGMLIGVPAAAAGVTVAVVTGIGGVPLSQIFDPRLWSQQNPLYLGVLVSSLMGSAGALLSAAGMFGEQLVGNRAPDLLAELEMQLEAQEAQMTDPAQTARLAPLQQNLAQAEAELARVASAVALADRRQEEARARALANLFGGPPAGGPTSRGPTNAGPTNGGPTNGGPTNGGPTTADPASTDPTSGDPTTQENSGDTAQLPPNSQLAPAVAAVAVAAGLFDGVTMQPGAGGLTTITLPDGRSVIVEVSLTANTTAPPVSVSQRGDNLEITVNPEARMRQAERLTAHEVAAFIATELGVPQGPATLSRAPLASVATPGELTVGDYANLGDLAETLQQAQRAGPVTRAVLDNRVTRLLEQTGLRDGALDAGARRALLPAPGGLAAALEQRDNGVRAYNETRTLRAALDNVARLAEATNLNLTVGDADPGPRHTGAKGESDATGGAVLHIGLTDGTTLPVRIEVAQLPTGTIAVPSYEAGMATVTLDGRVSSSAIQIALAGALAAIAAQLEGAPTGPRLLHPGLGADPVAEAGLTVEDLTVDDHRGLAQLRMAAHLSESALPTSIAARWHRALAEELGLHGSSDGATVRRGILTPAEERALASRHGAEHDEIVLARQFVEQAARDVGADSARVSADRPTAGQRRVQSVLTDHDGRQVRVDYAVVPRDANEQAVARVDRSVLLPSGEVRLRVTVTEGAAIETLQPTIAAEIQGALAPRPEPVEAPPSPAVPSETSQSVASADQSTATEPDLDQMRRVAIEAQRAAAEAERVAAIERQAAAEQAAAEQAAAEQAARAAERATADRASDQAQGTPEPEVADPTAERAAAIAAAEVDAFERAAAEARAAIGRASSAERAARADEGSRALAEIATSQAELTAAEGSEPAAPEGPASGLPDGSDAAPPDGPGKAPPDGQAGVLPQGTPETIAAEATLDEDGNPLSAAHGQRALLPHTRRVNSNINETLEELAATREDITRDADGTYRIQTPAGRSVTIGTAAAANFKNTPDVTGETTGTDRGRAVVDAATGSVEVEVSNRTTPRDVPRVLEHLIAEASAIVDGNTNRADILTAEELGDQQLTAENLSPSDLGRLAELVKAAAQVADARMGLPLRVSRESATLLRSLGLVSGRPDPETGEFVGRSEGYLQRRAALDPAARLIVDQLNSLPQVGSIPSGVPGVRATLAKAVSNAAFVGFLPAAALSVAAAVSGIGLLYGVAVVVAMAESSGALASNFLERRQARHGEYVAARDHLSRRLARAEQPLVRMQAAAIQNQLEQARPNAAPDTPPTGAEHEGGPDPAPQPEASEDRAEDVKAAFEAAQKPDRVPWRSAWVVRTAPSVFVRVAVSLATVVVAGLPVTFAAGIILGNLGALYAGRIEGSLARDQARGQDAQRALEEKRDAMMTEVRVERDTHELFERQAALAERRAAVDRA